MTLWLLPLAPLAGTALVAAARRRSRTALAWAACGTLAATLLLALAAAAGGWQASFAWSDALRLQAALTPVSAVVAALVPAVALPVLAYAAWHEERRGLPRLLALLLVFVGGMELLVIADDLLVLLVGWELVGACSWALIAHEWRDPANPRSALFAFIATRLGDLGLFLAAMVAFAGTGSFAYADLARLPAGAQGLVAAGVLLSAAAKSGQLPFSPWLFRAMAGPTSVSALLHAAAMVAAGAYLLLRLQPLLAPVPWFGPAVLAVGATTAVAAGVVALLQGHAKKLLAASTSAHYGLMFVATGVGYPGVALLHLVAHACFKAPLFLAVGIAGERSGGYALAGMRLGRALPATAALAAIAALALAGVPPLGAAWTKEAVVDAALGAGGWAAPAAVLAGALSAAYAVRLQVLAFGRGDAARAAGQVEPPHRAEQVALAVLAAATLALSVIGLPQVRAVLEDMVTGTLPPTGPGGTSASLLALAVGALAGWTLVRQQPLAGTTGAAAAAAEWLGLPRAIEHGLVRPFLALARAAARLDDALLSAAARAIAHATRGASAGLAVLDQRAIDRGTRAVARFTGWLSALGGRFGEWLADGLATGPARLVGQGGRDVRPLQGGQSHLYFTGMAAVAVLLVALLLLGG